jgi:hypothetical protein
MDGWQSTEEHCQFDGPGLGWNDWSVCGASGEYHPAELTGLEKKGASVFAMNR